MIDIGWLRGSGIRFSADKFGFIDPEIRLLLETNPSDPKIREYFYGESRICRILFDTPASHEMLNLVYANKNLNAIDRWLSESLSGQALRDRLYAVSSWCANRITESGVGHVLDLGSGPGPYAFETIRLLDSKPNLIWQCVDLNEEALAEGEEVARQLRLQNMVTFAKGNFMSRSSLPALDEPKADLGLLVGILCGMTPDEAVRCLKMVRLHLRKGARLIVPTLLEQAFLEDPWTFFVLCIVGGWQLKPKTKEQVLEIFERAELEVVGHFTERQAGNGQYVIVDAIVR